MATVSVNPPATRLETAILETSAVPPEPLSGLPEGVPYRLSADDYFRMVDADIIPPERRVGLWEGYLYEKMGKNLPHAVGQNLLISALMRSLPVDWCFWSESPILVNQLSAPLPDLTIVRGNPKRYSKRGSVPTVDDIGLVIEVADTSLRKNLTTTLQVYARAGLPVYWVVNLVARRVEVYSSPQVDESGVARYTSIVMFEIDQDVPFVLDGCEIARVPAIDLIPEEAASK